MNLSLIPLLPFTAAFMAGILLQGCGMGGFFIILPLAAAIAAAILNRIYAGILLASLALGFGAGYLNTPDPAQPLLTPGSPVTCSGVIIEVKHHEPNQIAIIDVDSCNFTATRHFKLKITVPSSNPILDERCRIRFTGIPQHLTFDPDLPDEIDYNATLRRSGVISRMFVTPDCLTVLRAEPGLLNSIRRQREQLTVMIAGLRLNGPTKEFLNAALTGDRSMLSPATAETFSSTGLAHILALSGLHVGVLTLILSVMLLPLHLAGMRKLKTLILLSMLWLFAIMTGLTPSVVRAVIMASIFMISAILQRVRTPFNSLCLAALLILLFTPHAIYSIGFQLSFFAVIAILIFAPKLNPVSPRRQVLHFLASYPAVTLAAILGTGMISAFYFHIFPLYAIPVNFISALLLPFILGGGIILLICSASGIQAQWLSAIIDGLYDTILTTATWFSKLPGALIDGIVLTPLSISAWMLTLVALASYLHNRRPAVMTATLMLAIFTLSTILLQPSAGNGAELYITRSHDNTNLLIRQDNTLSLASTAKPHQIKEITDHYNSRYRLFMMKRDIDSIRILPHKCRSSLFERDGNIFKFKTCSIALITDKSQIKHRTCKINYAIVCKGFRGDILELARELQPDTILLSADLNRRRHNRYDAELSRASVPHRSLRQSAFSLKLKSNS